MTNISPSPLEWVTVGTHRNVVVINYRSFIPSVCQELGYPVSDQFKEILDMYPTIVAPASTVMGRADEVRQPVLDRSKEILDKHEMLLAPYSTIIGRGIDAIYLIPTDERALQQNDYFLQTFQHPYQAHKRRIENFTVLGVDKYAEIYRYLDGSTGGMSFIDPNDTEGGKILQKESQVEFDAWRTYLASKIHVP